MRSIVATALLAALAFQADAAQIMDGSGAGFDKDIADKIARALAMETNDPYSAEIILLRKTESGTLCAFVNLKNLTGAYSGFQQLHLLAGRDVVAQLGDFPECATGTDPLIRREQRSICDTTLNHYVYSATAEDESAMRACMSEFRNSLFYLRAVDRIKKAGLPLAKEFK